MKLGWPAEKLNCYFSFFNKFVRISVCFFAHECVRIFCGSSNSRTALNHKVIDLSFQRYFHATDFLFLFVCMGGKSEINQNECEKWRVTPYAFFSHCSKWLRLQQPTKITIKYKEKMHLPAKEKKKGEYKPQMAKPTTNYEEKQRNRQTTRTIKCLVRFKSCRFLHTVRITILQCKDPQ